MGSPADLTKAPESMHHSASEPSQSDPALPPLLPKTIDSLPNETLTRILELAAEPIALRADWQVARAAADTLLAASLVSHFWQEVARPVLEKNCCIVLPFSNDQETSYTSRSVRKAATSMVIRAEPDYLPAQRKD